MFCWACGRCKEARNASHSAPISASAGRVGMSTRRLISAMDCLANPAARAPRAGRRRGGGGAGGGAGRGGGGGKEFVGEEEAARRRALEAGVVVGGVGVGLGDALVQRRVGGGAKNRSEEPPPARQSLP